MLFLLNLKLGNMLGLWESLMVNPLKQLKKNSQDTSESMVLLLRIIAFGGKDYTPVFT